MFYLKNPQKMRVMFGVFQFDLKTYDTLLYFLKN